MSQSSSSECVPRQRKATESHTSSWRTRSLPLLAKSHMGFGGALMDWILEQGSELECDEVHVDTGFHRHEAHRLYLTKVAVQYLGEIKAHNPLNGPAAAR